MMNKKNDQKKTSCTHKDNCELDTRAYARRLSQGQKKEKKKKR